MIFEPLAKHHDRSAFRSDDTALDDWFRNRAGQDDRRNVARVFVALDGETIAGFYSLGAFSLGLSTLPKALAAKLPRYEAVPAALIGRLAPFEKTSRLARIGTRLKGLDPVTQEKLINWGYAICDLGVRKHVDKSLPVPTDFPFPGAGV